MSTEANKALVRRFYQEIDKGNLAAMDELVAEDYIDHSPPPFPGLAPGRTLPNTWRFPTTPSPMRFAVPFTTTGLCGCEPSTTNVPAPTVVWPE